MPAVLPGKPQPTLQAISTGRWSGRRIVAYISGQALTILCGPDIICQTIYHDGSEPLQAVAFDETSGKVATCSERGIYIYKPNGQARDGFKWSQQHCIRADEDESSLATLSWGTAEELLVGSSSLRISSTTDSPATIWKRKLANPVKYALFSHDATLIASTGQYDRLLKIWRRLSFDVNDSTFDFAYLPHPMSITNVYWQRSSHPERSINDVLYTICADNVLRIWAASDPHNLQILDMWTKIDLQESIKPRLYQPGSLSTKRYAFIIDSDDFILATEQAVQGSGGDDRENHAIDHLLEVANRTPEVCVVLDEDGRMSAWGIEDPGSKSRKTAQVFNIAHIDAVKVLFHQEVKEQASYMRIYCFVSDLAGTGFTLLVHHFDGRIEWWETQADALFDPSPRRKRLQLMGVWSGHGSSLKKIVRSVSGKAVVSRTDLSEAVLWRQRSDSNHSRLVMRSIFPQSQKIHRICVVDEGDIVVLLHQGSISVWNTKGTNAMKIASQSFTLDGKPLCLILLPEVTAKTDVFHMAVISSEMKGLACEICITSPSDLRDTANGESEPAVISEFCRFDLGSERDLAFMIPVDPAGSIPTISGFLDVFARDVVTSFNTAGVLRSWTAKVDVDHRRVQWLLTSAVNTGIDNPSLVSGSSIRKAALVDSQKTKLTIWDTREAQLEFAKVFEDMIRDLDWTSTPDNQSVLAVGFAHHVFLFSQLRYDYLDAGPAWGIIRDIRIGDLTPHPIGDSVWLSHGDLLVGAGNQLFVYDRKMEIEDNFVTDLRLSAKQPLSKTLFSIVTRLNGQLPVFHPQFLSQCMLQGKMLLAQRILVSLQKRLKFHSEGDEIDTFLDIPIDDFLQRDEERFNPARKEMHSSYADFIEEEPEDDVLTETLAASLNEKLTTILIPQLSGREQFHLADIVECLATAEKHRRSMDDNASRFLVFFRQYILRKSQRRLNSSSISWREITWAFHSDSQEILVDMVSRQYHGQQMQWEHARESGMFMWLKDVSAVRAQFEIIARNHYTRTDEKNPIDCSLYYLALRKKNILIGLWRMAAWNPEQRSTQKFLGNNFQDTRWKTAALKNAYALLGRHRYEYAAAFFLLADSLKDAINTCVNQLDDLQLGITIARVYEGDDGPVLRDLLETHVLPMAAAEGNRWLATWTFWMLNRRDMAVRALVSPLDTLLPQQINSTHNNPLQSKFYLTDDPALVIAYRQLREKTLQTLRGATQVSQRTEWDFLIHHARLYDRMGCDLLALDLVRNWEFLYQPAPALRTKQHATGAKEKLKRSENPFEDEDENEDDGTGEMMITPDPRKLLRRRSSLVVADLPTPMHISSPITSPRRTSSSSAAAAARMAGMGAKDSNSYHMMAAAIEEGEEGQGGGGGEGRGTSGKSKKDLTFEEPSAESLLDSFGY
ncbi:MAG: regulator of (H+)-ATPase in vacuolar membrane [Peltula sp. TS41687]|nr:MAG: regulator of (H+)-ATPase in vacuolar membrane [Peltula sp. TS41687]